MAYRDGLTPDQIKALYTPNAPVVALRRRLADMRSADPRATMADVISALVTESSGEPVRYVNGALVRVRA